MVKDLNVLVLPDVIGYEVNEALEILKPLGKDIRVEVTKPIFATKPSGGARVVRLKLMEDTSLQVIVAYQDYLKGGA